MPRRKSKVQLLDELGTGAINVLLSSTIKKVVPPINAPYLTICLTSGRVQDAINHLSDAMNKLKEV